MYLELYLYPVLEDKKEQFIKINHEAERIYKEYGALESYTFAAESIHAEYGCAGMISAVELREGEVLMMEINRYHSKSHHTEVLQNVDQDDRIGELYEQMTKVIDIDLMVRGEFSLTEETR